MIGKRRRGVAAEPALRDDPAKRFERVHCGLSGTLPPRVSMHWRQQEPDRKAHPETPFSKQLRALNVAKKPLPPSRDRASSLAGAPPPRSLAELVARGMKAGGNDPTNILNSVVEFIRYDCLSSGYELLMTRMTELVALFDDHVLPPRTDLTQEIYQLERFWMDNLVHLVPETRAWTLAGDDLCMTLLSLLMSCHLLVADAYDRAVGQLAQYRVEFGSQRADSALPSIEALIFGGDGGGGGGSVPSASSSSAATAPPPSGSGSAAKPPPVVTTTHLTGRSDFSTQTVYSHDAGTFIAELRYRLLTYHTGGHAIRNLETNTRDCRVYETEQRKKFASAATAGRTQFDGLGRKVDPFPAYAGSTLPSTSAFYQAWKRGQATPLGAFLAERSDEEMLMLCHAAIAESMRPRADVSEGGGGGGGGEDDTTQVDCPLVAFSARLYEGECIRKFLLTGGGHPVASSDSASSASPFARLPFLVDAKSAGLSATEAAPLLRPTRPLACPSEVTVLSTTAYRTHIATYICDEISTPEFQTDLFNALIQSHMPLGCLFDYLRKRPTREALDKPLFKFDAAVQRLGGTEFSAAVSALVGTWSRYEDIHALVKTPASNPVLFNEITWVCFGNRIRSETRVDFATRYIVRGELVYSNAARRSSPLCSTLPCVLFRPVIYIYGRTRPRESQGIYVHCSDGRLYTCFDATQACVLWCSLILDDFDGVLETGENVRAFCATFVGRSSEEMKAARAKRPRLPPADVVLKYGHACLIPPSAPPPPAPSASPSPPPSLSPAPRRPSPHGTGRGGTGTGQLRLTTALLAQTAAAHSHRSLPPQTRVAIATRAPRAGGAARPESDDGGGEISSASSHSQASAVGRRPLARAPLPPPPSPPPRLAAPLPRVVARPPPPPPPPTSSVSEGIAPPSDAMILERLHARAMRRRRSNAAARDYDYDIWARTGLDGSATSDRDSSAPPASKRDRARPLFPSSSAAAAAMRQLSARHRISPPPLALDGDADMDA